MGRGDSSWHDRKHHIGKPRNKKSSLGQITPPSTSPEGSPTVGGSVGTEGYDSTKAITAIDPSSKPQVGESIMSGGTGANETYDYSKGYKGTSASTATIKKRKSSLKINISGASGTGRNIV